MSLLTNITLYKSHYWQICYSWHEMIFLWFLKLCCYLISNSNNFHMSPVICNCYLSSFKRITLFCYFLLIRFYNFVDSTTFSNTHLQIYKNLMTFSTSTALLSFWCNFLQSTTKIQINLQELTHLEICDLKIYKF